MKIGADGSRFCFRVNHPMRLRRTLMHENRFAGSVVLRFCFRINHPMRLGRTLMDENG
jgi:hypothetical protein